MSENVRYVSQGTILGWDYTAEVKYAGHLYTVEVIDGKITRIGCKGRWPLASADMVGDEGWLKKTLEQVLCLGEWATK